MLNVSFFGQLSRMKMLNIIRVYTTDKQKKLRKVIKKTKGDIHHFQHGLA